MADQEKNQINKDQNIKDLLEKNLKWSQLIYEQNKRIKSRLTWMVIGNYLKLAIVVIPLILAAIYLPPLIQNTVGQYQQLFGEGTPSALNIQEVISSIPAEDIQQLLKDFAQ